MSPLALTGCDASCLWQLAYFLPRFRATNPNETLVVADFGMTPAQLEQLAADPRVSRVITAKHPLGGWFCKAPAMRQALNLSDLVLWIDTDCDVRGPIARLWQWAQTPDFTGFAGTVDVYPYRGAINTGVLLLRNGPLLTRWIMHLEKRYRGDQECLATLVDFRSPDVSLLPKWAQSLRLIPVPGALIVHHTGPEGKTQMKAEMAKEKR